MHLHKINYRAEAAALLALTLAYERFPGKSLIVEGTPDFKNKLAEIAGVKGLAVCFIDPDMQMKRDQLVTALELAEAEKKKVQVIGQEPSNDKRSM